MELFDALIESSKIGIRKPDPRIYLMMCEKLGVTPDACVYLDDLGGNLKPARALGMTTIKVESGAASDRGTRSRHRNEIDLTLSHTPRSLAAESVRKNFHSSPRSEKIAYGK